MNYSLTKIIQVLTGRDRSKSIKIAKGARLEMAASVQLQNVSILLENQAELLLEEQVKLDNVHIHVLNGKVKIGTKSILGGNSVLQPVHIYVEQGSLEVSDHSVIRSDISIRFGGSCIIGRYTGIMQGTEIRCDEKVTIGDFVMISYECMIYDTNTHVQYPVAIRRAMTEKSFPHIGAEHEKPLTAAVIIGDDCWLGKRAVVLKGVKLGNNCTVATNAVLTRSCPDGSLAYGNPAQFKPGEKNEHEP